MKNRPLLSGCLSGFLLISLCIIMGGARFVKELRPSVLEEVIERKAVVRLYGQIYDIDVKDQYQIIYLKNNSIIYQNKSFEESKILIYDETKLNIEIGNQIEVSGELSIFERERNPGNFNQKLYYQKQGMHASVWASRIIVVNENVSRFKNSLYNFRIQWKEMLLDILGKEDGAVLAAMLLAEKSGMNEEMKELYQVNGIGHILAISGLHLSVIGVGLYKIFRRLSGSFLVGGIAGVSFLILYIFMIGVSVSVLRALLMFLFRVGADMTGRHYDSPTALGFSALITILWNPLYLYDGGFWLSYGAILAIILVLPIFENLMLQGFWASVSINLVTVPILLYFFYEIPIYSMFLNMLVVPLMTVVLICGLAGSLCSAVFISEGVFGTGGIGGLMLKVCSAAFEIYERGCTLFLALPGARIVAGQPEMWQMAVYYGVLLLVLAVWWKWKFRKGIMVIILILNMVLILVPIRGIGDRMDGEVIVTILDVSQGDGIFIKGPEGNTYLIDGGSSDIKKVGKYRMEPFLKSQGVGEIDYIFISHGDGDHINGIEEMIERMNVGVTIETIIFPNKGAWDEKLKELARLAMTNGIQVVEMKEGQVLTEGKLKICCLAPAEESDMYKGNSNAQSMVLALRYGEFDMLLTGDVENEGEEILIENLKEDYMGTTWDILKVAHHGSKNSTSEEFLETVSPAYAFVSAGRENSYGHPHMETMERLSDANAKILSTQENGAITVKTNGEKMWVNGYMNEK